MWQLNIEEARVQLEVLKSITIYALKQAPKVSFSLLNLSLVNVIKFNG